MPVCEHVCVFLLTCTLMGRTNRIVQLLLCIILTIILKINVLFSPRNMVGHQVSGSLFSNGGHVLGPIVPETGQEDSFHTQLCFLYLFIWGANKKTKVSEYLVWNMPLDGHSSLFKKR